MTDNIETPKDIPSKRPFSRNRDSRPPRREGSARPPFRSREGGDRDSRPPRREGSDRPPFRSREGGDRDSRPPRREGSDRPPFRSREGGDRDSRPPRREGSDRPPFRSREGGDRDSRPPRREGSYQDRPRFDKPRFDRPRDDRPRQERPKFAAIDASLQGVALEGEGERVAKVMARVGFSSRRDAENMIAEGRVAVNGVTLTTPAFLVKDEDKITVDGAPLPVKEKTRLWLYHKPSGLVTTNLDPEGRPTVFDNLPEGLPRVVSVGRLDINTEGLLLLTNDGGLSRVLELPITGWLRRYRVRVFGQVTPQMLDSIADGVTIDGVNYGAVEARVDRAQGDNTWLTLGIREGKNREVKRILEHLGLQVSRLIRISFGPFQLGEMDEGAVEEVRTRVLKDQLGTDLAREAQVDFDLPVREGEEAERHSSAAPRGARPQRESRDSRPQSRFSRDSGSRDRDSAGSNRERSGGRGGFDRPARDFSDRPRFNKEGDGGERRPSRDRPSSDRAFDRGERSDRKRDDTPRQEERSSRPDRFAKKTSAWRQGETENGETSNRRKPFRGDDAKSARYASAERPHRRAGNIEDPQGRAIKVERVIPERKNTLKVRPREGEYEARTSRPRSFDGVRSERSRDERPNYDRSRQDGSQREFPRRERTDSDRPRFDKPREERGYRSGGGERNFERPSRERNSDRSSFERPSRDRHSNERPASERTDRSSQRGERRGPRDDSDPPRRPERPFRRDRD